MLLHVVAPADDAHGNEGKGEKQNKTKKVPKFYFIPALFICHYGEIKCP
jgi:hypothetical protein